MRLVNPISFILNPQSKPSKVFKPRLRQSARQIGIGKGTKERGDHRDDGRYQWARKFGWCDTNPGRSFDERY